MSYVRDNLIAGEVVRYEAKVHWSIYLTLASILTLGLYAFIRRRTSGFAVTNKRVIIKTGLVARHTLELNLTKVESVGVEQDLGARIFGYGQVTVIGTGGTKEPFKYIAAPLAFRKAVSEAQEAFEMAARGTRAAF